MASSSSKVYKLDMKKLLLAATLALVFNTVTLAQDAPAQDNLNHYICIWIIDRVQEVGEPDKEDVYHPGKKIPGDAKKKHKETVRLVAAKEFKTEAEIDKFIANAPPELRARMHKICEDAK